jgi:hypothetical protein
MEQERSVQSKYLARDIGSIEMCSLFSFPYQWSNAPRKDNMNTIPNIQLASAVITLRKLDNQPELLAKRERIIVDQLSRNHQALTRKEITDALWAKYVSMHNAKAKRA